MVMPLGVTLIEGDCVQVMPQLQESLESSVDLLLVDPPYFAGKADWDRRRNHAAVVAFHERWIDAALPLLSPNGALWVSGTFHSIHAIGHLLQSAGMRIVNEVTWEKVNPPPARCRRTFVHATETLLWATQPDARYRFNYDCMRRLNGGKQMRSHWRMASPSGTETKLGRHPGQKPLALIERILLASTAEGDLILDPFLGSGTTAIASHRAGRRCIGIEERADTLELARRRLAHEAADEGHRVGQEAHRARRTEIGK